MVEAPTALRVSSGGWGGGAAGHVDPKKLLLKSNYLTPLTKMAYRLLDRD